MKCPFKILWTEASYHANKTTFITIFSFGQAFSGGYLIMLLSLMRKHAKSWLIKFLIAIIAVVFIFYFGYSFTEQEGAKVAEVNGEIISRSINYV